MQGWWSDLPGGARGVQPRHLCRRKREGWRCCQGACFWGLQPFLTGFADGSPEQSAANRWTLPGPAREQWSSWVICVVQRPGKRKSKSPGLPSALESQPVLILSLLRQELGECHFLLPVVTAALPGMAAGTEGSSEALLSSPPAIATSAFPAVYSSANLLLEPW